MTPLRGCFLTTETAENKINQAKRVMNTKQSLFLLHYYLNSVNIIKIPIDIVGKYGYNTGNKPTASVGERSISWSFILESFCGKTFVSAECDAVRLSG